MKIIEVTSLLRRGYGYPPRSKKYPPPTPEGFEKLLKVALSNNGAKIAPERRTVCLNLSCPLRTDLKSLVKPLNQKD
jgi:hypothetical protein